DRMPIRMEFVNVDGEDGAVSMAVTQPGAEIIVSGDPNAVRYDFNYPELGLGDFDVEAEDLPEDFPLVIDMVARNYAGFMAFSDGDLRAYDSVTSMDAIEATFNVDVPESEGGGALDFAFSISDIQQSISGVLGQLDLTQSMSEMIAGGMRQQGEMTHGAAAYSFDIDSPDGAMAMQAAAGSGSLGATVGEDGISYDVSTNDFTVAISGDMIPFPVVNLSMAESGGALTMPIVPGDDPQDFGLVTRMVGLEIDDFIWSMFDPGEQLPRDPATLVIDLGGKAVVTEDFTSPEFAENMSAPTPGTLEELTINALQLSVAGAELTGTGDFKFNNDGFMPMPAGSVDLSLTGANTLIDTLVGMGLLPEEQAMGARMMMGMFARPGPGEDTLTSQIEVTEDGQVLANGQRIR
ncbi:MAG: DUF2125 domain-containing protein, partial [Pseudomonadota bacterium]